MSDPVFKILTQAEWRGLQSAGEFIGSELDCGDGYIHLSTAEQWPETAARHFAGRSRLVLAAVETEGLEVRWEPSRGGALFPHLYEPLPLSAVVAARSLSVTRDGTPRPGDLVGAVHLV
jgi:uncharacterized protein (DUF952 family)